VAGVTRSISFIRSTPSSIVGTFKKNMTNGANAATVASRLCHFGRVA
jgi:hypothetical protein